MKQRTDTAIILTSFAEKNSTQPVLGTGGWLPPEEREALDWMTLIALMGWNVQLRDPFTFQLAEINDQPVKWIILTGDPDEINSETWERLLLIAKTKKLLFICRAGKMHLSEKISSGNQLVYKRAGFCKRWGLSNPLQLHEIVRRPDVDVLVTLSGTCIAASGNLSGGKILYLGFHPSMVRDREPVFTALLKQLLIKESLHPVAWFDWENTLILRMDDPGSAQPVHDNSFHQAKLGEKEWKVIGEELYKRKARMSLAYVSAWVDDGDNTRGRLEIDGQTVSRLPGKIYPSPLVKYSKICSMGASLVFDYEAEFRGIQQLRNNGLAEVELHGYTHMHPDRASWLKAEDKYENKKWYREFGRSSIRFVNSQAEDQHPLHLGIKAFREIFHTLPSTLICPGEEFTNEVLERAMEAGLNMVSSYYLGMRIGHQLCWNQHLCSPYLDLAAPHWFDQEIPVVGYFHDFDLTIHGTHWFANNLDAWQRAGAKFFIDFRELSHILSYTISMSENADSYQLNLLSDKKAPLIKPVRVGIHIPGINFTLKLVLNKDQESYHIPLSCLAS